MRSMTGPFLCTGVPVHSAIGVNILGARWPPPCVAEHAEECELRLPRETDGPLRLVRLHRSSSGIGTPKPSGERPCLTRGPRSFIHTGQWAHLLTRASPWD